MELDIVGEGGDLDMKGVILYRPEGSSIYNARH